MTEHRFQLSDRRRDAIIVARGDDPTEVVAAFDTLLTAFDNTFGTMPPADHAGPAQQMVQRPVNQPGGLGAVPVQQSGGGDIMLCPNGGGAHQFKQGVSQKTGNLWKCWECPDRRCNFDGKGGNRQWIR